MVHCIGTHQGSCGFGVVKVKLDFMGPVTLESWLKEGMCVWHIFSRLGSTF